MRQTACKPGSVLGNPRDGHSSGTSVAGRLARPTRTAVRKQTVAVPIWSCSRWGLPCRVCCRPRGALLPHRFTLASAGSENPEPIGGLISVALSLGSPPPDVIRHRVSVEPGLSSSHFHQGRSDQRPSGHLTPRRYNRPVSLCQVPKCPGAGRTSRDNHHRQAGLFHYSVLEHVYERRKTILCFPIADAIDLFRTKMTLKCSDDCSKRDVNLWRYTVAV